MDWSSGGRTERAPYLRPHQKKERLPSRSRGGFSAAPSDVAALQPPVDDIYWSWKNMSGWKGHTVVWRPRLRGVSEQERLTTMTKPSGPTGVQGTTGRSGVMGPSGPVRPNTSGQARSQKKIKKECLSLSATTALEHMRTGRSTRGYSPFMLEVRCLECEAGCTMTLASAERGGTVADCLEEMLELLQGRWEDKTCREVKEHLTALLVMES